MGKETKTPDNMTFLEHLEDLRKRIFYSFVAVIVAVIPSWFFSKDIFNLLAKPITRFLPEGEQLVFTSLPAPFFLYMKVAFLTAIFAVAPFLFLQVWYFVAPGLFRREKKHLIPFVVFTTVFFTGGAAFAFLVVFPFACSFFLNMGAEFQALITIDQYFSLAMRIILGIALVFEMPTLVYFLARMGLISARLMVKHFKYAVLLVFVIAAVITPTPDMFTQSIIAVPMLILYGLSILIALVVGKQKQRAREKDAEEDLSG
ncbi:MAG: twin-arginine translocase subunit TatC [Candidatus Aminicenantaceae bacterium]